jgi:hypothetical protein
MIVPKRRYKMNIGIDSAAKINAKYLRRCGNDISNLKYASIVNNKPKPTPNIKL